MVRFVRLVVWHVMYVFTSRTKLLAELDELNEEFIHYYAAIDRWDEPYSIYDMPFLGPHPDTLETPELEAARDRQEWLYQKLRAVEKPGRLHHLWWRVAASLTSRARLLKEFHALSDLLYQAWEGEFDSSMATWDTEDTYQSDKWACMKRARCAFLQKSLFKPVKAQPSPEPDLEDLPF